MILDLVQPPNMCERRTLYRLAHALPSAEQERAVWLLQRVFDAHMARRAFLAGLPQA